MVIGQQEAVVITLRIHCYEASIHYPQLAIHESVYFDLFVWSFFWSETFWRSFFNVFEVRQGYHCLTMTPLVADTAMSCTDMTPDVQQVADTTTVYSPAMASADENVDTDIYTNNH